ncbi:hypothetical protein COCC4DRAFT_124384 [Bipolaris maydis ATCC 48331]|uniref:Uncharacterized protein n=2 Tax=Cochliobolus heterostrophus TaxID=5016 RepID=M2UC10_COCH5|nr:uncharacterized protein COCC4DRAFT_124384 [Bipolaris maydis ATCC 48331]EMD96104.1 hypothetical protein COCHEDRAFT_1088081 [Bipolaris maydis C5]ENI10963.1 hypothetical protein COCC4DRAFT_124384 [Bipolaris maydis ATCC 48331]
MGCVFLEFCIWFWRGSHDVEITSLPLGWLLPDPVWVYGECQMFSKHAGTFWSATNLLSTLSCKNTSRLSSIGVVARERSWLVLPHDPSHAGVVSLSTFSSTLFLHPLMLQQLCLLIIGSSPITCHKFSVLRPAASYRACKKDT